MRFCPYLGQETDEPFNKEHVIPSALGGADVFCIEVCKSMNTKGHLLIENQFVHDVSMRKRKTECNVISRSGQTPQYKVPGEFADGTKVSVAVDANGTRTIMPGKPVDVVATENSDGSTNLEVTVLLHDSDPNRENLEKVERAKAKLGDVTNRTESKLEGPIRAEATIDLTALLRGMAKIACATCCFKFPDWARTAHADKFRKILDESWEPGNKKWEVEWQWVKRADKRQVLFPPVEACQHVVFLYGTPSGELQCGVKMFGGKEVAAGDQKTALFVMHDGSKAFLADAHRWYAICDAPARQVKFIDDELKRPAGCLLPWKR